MAAILHPDASVPFVDLGRENRALRVELLEAADRVLRSGRLLFGAELEAFEHEIAAWHGVKFAVGVASGTDAVEIALRATSKMASDDDRNDVVSVTAFTAVPTINAIEAAGCTPELVDPQAHTRNATFTALAVHLYGLPVAAEGADVEDVAHAMGARMCGRLTGTMGACGALSFYPSKIMGAVGDGGAIITDEPGIAERARKIRHYGFEESGDIAMRGQNSRLSELQAAFLRVKLPHVEGWIDRRREIAARYSAELAGRVTVPVERDDEVHVYHVYVIEHPERDRIKAALVERGIGTQIHYARAIHQHERWAHLGEPFKFEVAERLASTVLSLPCYPYLLDSEQDAVIAAVKDCT